MIGTLARKRTNVRLSHLTALAVMIALVGAMFVAMAPARADHDGTCTTTQTLKMAREADTSATPPVTAVPAGHCTIENPFTGGIATVDVSGKATSVVIADASGDVLVTAGDTTGTATLKVKWATPADANPVRTSEVMTYAITVVPYSETPTVDTTVRSVTLSIVDSDNTVGNAATGQYRFTITTKNIPALPATNATADPAVPPLTVYVSGELDNVEITVPTPADGTRTQDQKELKYTGMITVPKGTTPSKYTLDVTIYRVVVTTTADGSKELSASVAPPKGDPADGTTRVSKGYSGSAVLTVGDASSNVSEATLVLSPLDADGDPVAEGSSQKTQAASSAAKGDPIRLTLTALNGLGKMSNPPIDVTITAAGAMIKHSHSISATGAYVAVSGTSDESNSIRLDNVPVSSIVLEISKETPGEVEVSALIVDENGSGYDGSDKVMLTFTGPAKTVSLSDATTTLLNQYKDHKVDDDDKDTDPRDNIALKLTASDADGHAVVPTSNANVAISGPAGPDSSIVSTEGPSQKIVVSQAVKGTTNTITLRVAASVTAANPLKSGEYTVTVKDGTKKDTAKFTVVGLAGKVEIKATEADEDGQIDVTVTVTDAAGNHVADGTEVMIETADLRGDSDRVILRTSTTGKTKAGVAKATFIEIGPGRAAIIATADGQTDVERVTSTFDAPVVVEEEPEVASLSCLSNLSGFSTWTCEVEASASEIFGWISSRGATALHLSSAGMWVRYSVVEGTLVPGSSDFTVRENDILYISN